MVKQHSKEVNKEKIRSYESKLKGKHTDEKQDKVLIKKMVKKTALK